MSLNIDSTNVPNTGKILYNNTDLSKVVCNGVTVWEKYVAPPAPAHDAVVTSDRADSSWMNPTGFPISAPYYSDLPGYARVTVVATHLNSINANYGNYVINFSISLRNDYENATPLTINVPLFGQSASSTVRTQDYGTFNWGTSGSISDGLVLRNTGFVGNHDSYVVEFGIDVTWEWVTT